MQTSNNGYTWDKDAKYSYYDHGPLARTELGDQKVQAMDYAYTLQGWIKAVNSETLNSSRDIGKDGVSGNTNKYVGSDAFGYSLAYFNNDYTPIGGTSAQTFMASVSGNTALAADTKDLYNGNISRMVTTMTNTENDLDKRVVMPRMASYKYDQLNRIKQAKSYMDINFSTNAWGNDNNDSYKETFCYDANGNITDLTRNQKYIGTGTPLELDHMRYNYEKIGVDASYKKYTNKLTWVDELATPTSSINDDIEDQYLDNYKYDDIGNLTYDRNEEIDLITWTVSGKVKEVKRKSTSTKYDLEFLYDATGKRIAKIKKPAATKTDATTWITTWYMHDASGNVMATYEYRNPLSADKFCLKEQMIYGSARLGICEVDLNLLTTTTLPTLSERILGNKYFEQSNHLGNVISVVSDKRIPYDAQGANLVPNPHMDNSTSGLATSWVWLGTSFQGSPSIVTGNGFTGNAQRVDMGSSSRPIIKALFSTVAGKQYKISLKYRTNATSLKLSGNTSLSSWGQVIPINTGNAVTVSYIVTTTGNENGFSLDLNVGGVAGYWFEFDDVVLQDAEGIIDSYQASVISTSDYYAFGSPMYDRTHYDETYRYGFNGKENDGETSTQDYGLRIYNPALGRFLSLDPLASKFAWNSPYCFAENTPVWGIDVDGGELKPYIDKFKEASREALGKDNYEKIQKNVDANAAKTLIVSAKLMYWGVDKANEQVKQTQFKSNPTNSVAILLYEFATGTGQDKRTFNYGEKCSFANAFVDGRVATDVLKSFNDKAKDQTQEEFKKNGVTFGLTFSPDQTDGIKESIEKHTNSNLSQLFVGGAIVKVTATDKEGWVNVSVTNVTSRSSLMAHAVGDYKRDGDPQTNDKPLSNISQTFNFSLKIDPSKFKQEEKKTDAKANGTN